jgi:4-amino-4-deoxy-L-arabinose transferase-like glycosyltransferase
MPLGLAARFCILALGKALSKRGNAPGKISVANPFNQSRLRSLALVVVVTVVGLLPFANKAFHIDDPLFLWAAKQIQRHPADFYGFKLNWYYSEMPMAEVTKNPPLACYYIALAASIFGWSEPALHLAFLLPAVAAIVGTYCLARRFCSQPALAALITLFTPAFLVSSTNVMCDTLMTAFWIWAVVLWDLGLRKNCYWSFLGAGGLIALGILTKYFALSLVPLLLAYALAHRRKPGWWLLALSVPLAVMAGYEWLTESLYGQGLFHGAASYATATQQEAPWRMPLAAKFLIGLAFAGGSLSPILFFAPLLASRRMLWLLLGATLAIAYALYIWGRFGPFILVEGNYARWSVIGQAALLVVAGAGVLALAVWDAWTHRDAPAVLLLLWIAGTLFFTALVNWAINARSILPAAPALGILIARRLDQQAARSAVELRWKIAFALGCAALFTFVLTWTDYRLANSARTAARQIHDEYAVKPANEWFMGHWGFQYYMQELGARCIDANQLDIPAGDIIVVPINNANLILPPEDLSKEVATLRFPASIGVATMHPILGAGFYANRIGPLPFAFGFVGPEKYLVFAATKKMEGRLAVPH